MENARMQNPGGTTAVLSQKSRAARRHSGGPQGRRYRLRLWLGEIGAIQVELGNWDHFHLGEIFLERLEERRRLPDHDEARRAIEIFRGERTDVLGRDRVNRGN